MIRQTKQRTFISCRQDGIDCYIKTSEGALPWSNFSTVRQCWHLDEPLCSEVYRRAHWDACGGSLQIPSRTIGGPPSTPCPSTPHPLFSSSVDFLTSRSHGWDLIPGDGIWPPSLSISLSPVHGAEPGFVLSWSDSGCHCIGFPLRGLQIKAWKPLCWWQTVLWHIFMLHRVKWFIRN